MRCTEAATLKHFLQPRAPLAGRQISARAARAVQHHGESISCLSHTMYRATHARWIGTPTSDGLKGYSRNERVFPDAWNLTRHLAGGIVTRRAQRPDEQFLR